MLNLMPMAQKVNIRIQSQIDGEKADIMYIPLKLAKVSAISHVGIVLKHKQVVRWLLDTKIPEKEGQIMFIFNQALLMDLATSMMKDA